MLRLFLLLSKGSEYCDAEIIAPVPTVKVDKSRPFHYRSRKIVFIDSPSLFVKCLNEVLCDFIDYDKFILPRLMEGVLTNFFFGLKKTWGIYKLMGASLVSPWGLELLY